MALPVIPPASLEKFPIVLNGAPLMLTGDQVGTASSANPAGLRVSGGNLFRDYTPWTELELDDWAQGIGHAFVDDAGFFDARGVNTTMDSLRLHLNEDETPAQGFSALTAAGGGTGTNNTRRWTTDPFMEGGFTEASDGNIYAFYGHEIWKYTPIDNKTGTWSQFLADLTGIFAPSWTAARDSYIIDMCEFAGYLIIVTTPFFRVTTSNPAPIGGLTLEQGTPTAVGDFTVWSESNAAGDTWKHAPPNVFAISLANPATIYTLGGGPAGTGVLPLTYTSPTQMGMINVGYHKKAADTPDEWDRHPYRESGVCATACYTFAGFLFIGGSLGYMYTSGKYSYEFANPSQQKYKNPSWWEFEGTDDLIMLPKEVSTYTVSKPESPYNLSTKHGGGRWVTGFAGMQGQTIGDTSVYMSTSRNLFLLDLAVPTQVEVMDYDGDYVRNGKGMTAYQNDLYIPTQNGVKRFTQSGQVIDVGVDTLLPQNPITPVTNLTEYYQHIELTPGVDGVFSVMAGYNPASVALRRRYPSGITMLKGTGWHEIKTVSHILSAHYASAVRTIFYMSGADNGFWERNFTPASLDVGASLHRQVYGSSEFVVDNMVASGEAQYESEYGFVNLGWYDGGARLLDKDWHSISIYGRCFNTQSYVTVWCRISDTPAKCRWQGDNPYDSPGVGGWIALGTIDKLNDAEFYIPTLLDECDPLLTRSGKYINIFLEFWGGDAGTPIVDGIKIKYFVPIPDYFRFQYSTTLSECLTDMCGINLPMYDQALWDEAIREAACSVEPVHFRDMDGKEYLVRVESESRRVSKLAYVGPPAFRTYDISWSVVLIEVMNPSMCDPSWEPTCP